MKLDEIDYKLLAELKNDSRITIRELSSRLNLSTTPIFERIKKLERNGIIDHYTVVLNEEKLGKKLTSFAHISLKDHSKELVKKFESQVLQIPEVIECHYVTGNADFIIKVLVDDIERYKEFVMDRLFDIPNIGKIETFLSLEMKKQNDIGILQNQ